MICLMHEGADYGHLKVGSKIITPAELSRMVGASVKQTEAWLLELVSAGVADLSSDGCYSCRRMIKDEAVRAKRAAGGCLGGNPRLKVTGKVKAEVNLHDNLQPTPSSASASSSSSSKKNTPPTPPLDPSPEPDLDALNARLENLKPPDPSNGGTYLTGPSEEFLAWWNAYPNDRRAKQNFANKQWQAAVVLLTGTTGMTEEAAQAYLLRAVLEYAQSPAGQPPIGGKDIRPFPDQWLEAGRWNDDRQAWQVPNGGESTKPRAHVPTTPSKSQRVLQ